MSDGAAQLDNQGVLIGSLTVDAALTTNAPGGLLRVDSGDLMDLTGTGHTLLNNGSIRLFGGRLDVAGVLTNVDSLGMIEGNGVLSAASMTNEANASIAFDADSILIGDVTNAGSIAILGASNLTFFDNLIQYDTFQIGDASRGIVFGDFSGVGGTSGAGTLEVAGTFSPGASPASVNFGGDLVLSGASGTLLEFEGDQVGEFDQVNATGVVLLGGGLDVDLLNAYVPPVGTAFVVINAESVTGEFDGVSNGDLVEDVAGTEFYIYYSAQQVVLTVPEPTVGSMLLVGILAASLVARRRRQV